jgi:surface carbohydrate biosynthesis protein
MRVVLLVNNPYRDLPGLILTALALSQQGVTCYLLPGQRWFYEIWALVPDLVLLDNLRTEYEQLTRRLVGAGIRVAVLDTEGAVFTSLDRYTEKLVRDPAVRRMVSLFCAWGPAMAKHMASFGWFDDSQITVTGTPRLDFYVHPWSDAALASSTYAAYAPPLVLINGTFNRANSWPRTPNSAIREVLGPGYDEETAQRWLQTEHRAQQEVVSLTRRLAEAFPGVTFVFRPHPFEDPDTYGADLSGYSNLHLVKRGSVEGWILRACAVLHCGSSTAVEAALAGRPALSPSWIPAPASYPIVDAVTVQCATEDELKLRLQQAWSEPSSLDATVQDNLREVLAEWFSAADGGAHQRVASAILGTLAGAGPVVSRRRCEDALEHLDLPSAGWRQQTRAWVRRTLGLPIRWNFRHWRQQPPVWAGVPPWFGVEDVQTISQALRDPMLSYCGGTGRDLIVDSAQRLGHYDFGYTHGCAVVISHTAGSS